MNITRFFHQNLIGQFQKEQDNRIFEDTII